MIPLVRYRLLSLKKCNVKYKLYIYISRNLERQNVENTKIKIKIKNKQTKKKHSVESLYDDKSMEKSKEVSSMRKNVHLARHCLQGLPHKN